MAPYPGRRKVIAAKSVQDPRLLTAFSGQLTRNSTINKENGYESEDLLEDDDGQRDPHTSGPNFKDNYRCRDGIKIDQPPLATLKEMFCDLTQKALERGFDKALFQFKNRALRVATMCSGTESPILAANMITQCKSSICILALFILSNTCSDLRTTETEFLLHFQHVFSAEIVPHKQDYIQRNFGPPIIFRDITELSKELDAYGKLQA
jgi:hypothetical protein